MAVLRSLPALIRLVLLILIPATARADFGSLPFALRLFLSVDRQSNYSSTLARQASIAALDGGSANPGAVAWRVPLEPTTVVTASYVDAPSTGGRSVIAAPVSLRWQAQDEGTIALAYAFTQTRNAEGNDGLVQSLRSDEWIGGYGRRFDEHSAVGFTARLTSGRIVNDAAAPALGGALSRNSTRFLAPDVALGYACDIGKAVTLGVVATYGVARGRTTVTNVGPLVVPLPALGTTLVLPPDSVLALVDDTISTATLGAGLGVHSDDATALYFDAKALRLSTHHSGSQNMGRFALGAEHRLYNDLVLRGGVGLDTIGNVNVSAGVGYRPTPSFEAQFAFQTNAAPELNAQLGRTRLLSASLAWIF
jgi:hypothetical protein